MVEGGGDEAIGTKGRRMKIARQFMTIMVCACAVAFCAGCVEEQPVLDFSTIETMFIHEYGEWHDVRLTAEAGRFDGDIREIVEEGLQSKDLQWRSARFVSYAPNVLLAARDFTINLLSDGFVVVNYRQPRSEGVMRQVIANDSGRILVLITDCLRKKKEFAPDVVNDTAFSWLFEGG